MNGMEIIESRYCVTAQPLEICPSSSSTPFQSVFLWHRRRRLVVTVVHQVTLYSFCPSLHSNLVEHLNAEIVLQTISDVNMALDWIRSTFLYIRALKNPTHYGPGWKHKQRAESVPAWFALCWLCSKRSNFRFLCWLRQMWYWSKIARWAMTIFALTSTKPLMHHVWETTHHPSCAVFGSWLLGCLCSLLPLSAVCHLLW